MLTTRQRSLNAAASPHDLTGRFSAQRLVAWSRLSPCNLIKRVWCERSHTAGGVSTRDAQAHGPGISGTTEEQSPDFRKMAHAS